MSKISKKELRQFIEEAGKQIFTHYKISSPSKKSEKMLSGFSRKFAEELKSLLKQTTKASAKKSKKVSAKKLVKNSDSKEKSA